MSKSMVNYRQRIIIRTGLFLVSLAIVAITTLSIGRYPQYQDIVWSTLTPQKSFLGSLEFFLGKHFFFLFGKATYSIPIIMIWSLVIFKKFQSKIYFVTYLISTFIFTIFCSAFLGVFSSVWETTGMFGFLYHQYILKELGLLASIFILGTITFASASIILDKNLFFILFKFLRGIRLLWIRMVHKKSVPLDKEVKNVPTATPEETPPQEDFFTMVEEEPSKVVPTESLEEVTATPIKKTKKSPKSKKATFRPYKTTWTPITDLLDQIQKRPKRKMLEYLNKKSKTLQQAYAQFGINVSVLNAHIGPVITLFEIKSAPGIKVSTLVNLSNDLSLAMKAKSLRMIAPIPGKSAIGIEIPNDEPETVFFRELIESSEFKSSEHPLTIALGKDVLGNNIVTRLDKMPHLLIAGATGAGKSVCMNTLIMSVLFKASPDEVQFIMVDPKMVELTFYNKIPHLVAPVVTEPGKAAAALRWAVREMERRYKLFSEVSVRNIEGYHQKQKEENLEKMPFIIVIVDELADLMVTSAKEVENSIARLAQLSRAVGIHIVLATQRPSVNVITGIIKANMPCRIAFRVSSSIDSRTILDSKGAEQLIGRGDMLFIPPGSSNTTRLQGCFVSDKETQKVVQAYVDQYGEPEFKEDLFTEVDESTEDQEFQQLENEPLYDEAVQHITQAQQASTSFLQRRLRIGYNRASRLIDLLESQGVIGPARSGKPREVLAPEDTMYE